MENVVSKMIDKGLFDSATAERVRSLLSEGKWLEDAVLAADGVSEEALVRASSPPPSTSRTWTWRRPRRPRRSWRVPGAAARAAPHPAAGGARRRDAGRRRAR